MYRLQEYMEVKCEDISFLLPEAMKELGFEPFGSPSEGYLQYKNNAKVQYNKDYNPLWPESRGKVVIYVNLKYTDSMPYIGIRQDADTRTSYNGICPNVEFLKMLLTSIR